MANKDEPKGTPKKDDSKGTPKGKVFTTADIDKIKADSAKMGQGRAETIAKQEKEVLTSELQSYKGRLDALEARDNEDRLAEARGDDDKMRAYQREQAVEKRERQADDRDRDITRREGQVKTAQEEVDKDKGVVTVAYIAAKHNLSVERLEKLGISDLETLEKVAEEMKPAESKGEDADTKAYQALETDAEKVVFVKAHPDFESVALKLDSGEGSGSGEKTDQERLDERYPTMANK